MNSERGTYGMSTSTSDKAHGNVLTNQGTSVEDTTQEEDEVGQKMCNHNKHGGLGIGNWQGTVLRGAYSPGDKPGANRKNLSREERWIKTHSVLDTVVVVISTYKLSSSAIIRLSQHLD